VNLFEQVAVTVEERPVDAGGSGDAGGADVLSAGGSGADGLDDAGAPPGNRPGVRAALLVRARCLGWSCGALGADGGQRLAQPRHAEGDGAVAADDRGCLADLLAFGAGQVAQPVLDPGDELADPGDFLLGGCGFGACPLRSKSSR
jgi:hypothetical protein